MKRIWSSPAVRLLGPIALVGLLILVGHKGAYLAVALLSCALVVVLFALSRRDVTTVVTIYIVAMVLLPSYLTIGDLGAAGSPTTIVGMAALAWWLVSRLVPGQPVATGHQPIRIGVYIFLASIVLSFASAFSREIPGVEISGANRGILEVLGLAGIALLMADGIETRERLDVLGRRLVYWVGVLSTFGIIQFVTGSTPFQSLYAHLPGFTSAYIPAPITSRGGLRRVQATTGSPIEFGLVLACVLPIAVHYAKQAPVGKQGRRWLCVVLIAVALPMSLARTGFVGAAIVFVVMYIGWNARERIVGVGAVVLFALGLRAAKPGLVGTIVGLFTNAGTDPSVVHREQDLARAGFLVRQSFFFGRGFGTFIPSEFTPPGQPVASLDNQYLGSLIETGIVGLACLILLLLIWLFTALGIRRRSREPATRELALALAASSLALAFGLYVFDAFSFDQVSGTMFILIGMTGALWRLARQEDVSPQIEPVRSISIPYA
ncbi:MAG: O-antigen ligase family protein [Acidimicrobiales bacterium]